MGREEGHLPESDRDESARLTPIESQSTPTTRWHSLAGFLLRLNGVGRAQLLPNASSLIPQN
jgi:hypothetical protein